MAGKKKSIPNRQYTQTFRAEAVKLVLDGGQSQAEVARRLDISDKTLGGWVCRARLGQALPESRPASGLSEMEAELMRLRQENARLREEKEILRKATAYFVKESR